jgi:hypothetical protein
VIQASTGPIPAADVRARIDDILARPEFGTERSVLGEWISDVIERILRALGRTFGIEPRGVGDFLVVALYVALAAGLVFLVWRIVRARLDARGAQDELPAELDPVEARRLRVSELRGRARTARASGELVLALRLYFTALVVGLGERGDLDYRDAWTNRELLERGEPSEHVERKLAPLVRDLDLRSFGGVPARDEDVEQMSRVVDELLGAEAR